MLPFLLLLLISVVVFLWSLHQTVRFRNPFGLTPYLWPLGIFVWGDGVVIGAFWVLVFAFLSWAQNWWLFGLIYSLFWVVRGWGEVQYWLHEQFAQKHRNAPETLLGYQFFEGDSIWFIYQVFWQCVVVLALLGGLYCARGILLGSIVPV